MTNGIIIIPFYPKILFLLLLLIILLYMITHVVTILHIPSSIGFTDDTVRKRLPRTPPRAVAKHTRI